VRSVPIFRCKCFLVYRLPDRSPINLALEPDSRVRIRQLKARAPARRLHIMNNAINRAATITVRPSYLFPKANEEPAVFGR
jgi:hypothetical protein